MCVYVLYIDIYIYEEREIEIDIKELAHMSVEAGKYKILRAG